MVSAPLAPVTTRSSTGFKQTEIGSIPSDWESPMLGEIVSSAQLGGNYPNSLNETAAPLIKMGNMGRGRISLARLEFVPTSFPAQPRDRLRRGDVLFNTRNTLELVGKVCIWNDDLPEAYFNSNILRLSFDSRFVSSQRFMSCVLNSDRAISALREIATGTTSVAAIYGRDLFAMRIPLPPKKEQRLIADALSDADALIESLETLVAKKRAIKQGAMQDLLSGRKRLPGFGGEWKAKKLGELGSFYKGSGVRKDEAQSGALPCIRYGEIYTHHNDIVREFRSFISPEIAATATKIQGGDILFAGSGETKEEIGKCVALTSRLEAYAGGDIIILRPVDCDARYLGYALNHVDVQRQKAAKGQGDAVVHISATALASLKIALPALAEQIAISEVLDNMDTEIAALGARLDKARQIKQGMMHELLTGRVRLV